jgi:S-adenosyl methyltransferase
MDIVDHPDVTDLLDFSEPVGVVLSMILPFISDTDDPLAILGQLRDAVVAGSYIVLSHPIHIADADAEKTIQQLSERTPTPGQFDRAGPHTSTGRTPRLGAGPVLAERAAHPRGGDRADATAATTGKIEGPYPLRSDMYRRVVMVDAAAAAGSRHEKATQSPSLPQQRSSI